MRTQEVKIILGVRFVLLPVTNPYFDVPCVIPSVRLRRDLKVLEDGMHFSVLLPGVAFIIYLFGLQ